MADVTNGTRTPLWQTLLSQLPWVISIFVGGLWYMAKADSRLVTVENRLTRLEQGIQRVEARQEQQQAEKLQDLQNEIARLRGSVKP